MFNFLDMMDTYEERKVASFEKDDLFVSTVRVTDSVEPYETAICYPKYNEGKLVIVEMYDTKEEAEAGHKKWVTLMTAKKLPEKLTDVSTSEIKQLLNLLEEKP